MEKGLWYAFYKSFDIHHYITLDSVLKNVKRVNSDPEACRSCTNLVALSTGNVCTCKLKTSFFPV